jgi:capsular exopolysaccharide synthesis family protein
MTDDAPLRHTRELPREQPHLRDYVQVVTRRWLLSLSAFTLVAAGAVAYTMSSTPVYEAHARLIIEPTTPDGGPPPAGADATEAGRADLETHYQLLQSRARATATLNALGAWDRFQPREDTPARPLPVTERITRAVKQSGRDAVAWASRLMGAPQRQAPRVADDPARREARAVNAFLGRLTVAPVQNSRLVEVSFRDADPAMAARIVNTLATTYIAETVDSQLSAVRDTSEWLTQQLADQRAQVAAAEAALQAYREKHDALSVEGNQNIVVQKLGDLNTAVTHAKTERLQREAVYRQVAQAADDPRALDALPAVVSNTFIQQQRAELSALQREQAQLGEKLGDRHPEMARVRQAVQAAQTRLRSAIQEVVTSLKNDYEAAVAQEDALTSALNQQKGEAQSLNRKGVQYAVLQRDAESRKQVYDSLLERARLSAVTGDRKASHVRLVDAATEPEFPIGVNPLQVLLIALIGGACVSVGLAFFAEYLDNRLKTPEAVEAHLRLTPLGAIPRKRRALRAGRSLVDYTVPSPLVEAFRGLRANVLFAAPDSLRSVAVTSASPGEGKTVIAANLAAGLAQAGQRVVLVDADLRRPKIHELFGLAMEPGLSNLLSHRTPDDSAVQATSIPNLMAVTAGALPPNPAELLGSARFTSVLRQLESHFDIVVIDTPPVMAVADASILAHQTSGVLFVVAADSTSRHAAQAALDQLERARGRFLGAVLNRVDGRLRRYYRASYFRPAPGKPLSVTQ